MINVKLTRNQLLGLMKELPENHWMQIRLMEALTKNEEKTQHSAFNGEAKGSGTANLLTASDVPLHRGYDGTYYNKEYAKDEQTLCDFNCSWSGQCKKPSIQGGCQCLEHFNVKCSMCNSVAVTDCGETFQFVCGAPLCQDHSNRHNCVSKNKR